MLVRCESCLRTFVRQGEGPGRCPRCGAAEPADGQEAAPRGPAGADGAPGDAASPPGPGASGAVLAEGSTKGASEAPARRQRGSIPPAPRRFVDGHPSYEERSLPFRRRFLPTAADVLLRPAAFFTHLSREGAAGITWYAFLCLLVGHTALAAWRLVLHLPLASWGLDVLRQQAAAQPASAEVRRQIASLDAAAAELARAEPVFWMQLLLAPVTAYFAIHLLSGIVHLGCRAFTTTPEEPVRYEATYRYFVYAMTPMLLAVVPVLGGLASLWTVAVLSIAMVKLHRLRFLGVVGGVVMPALFVSLMWGTVVDQAGPALAEALGAHVPPRSTVELPSP